MSTEAVRTWYCAPGVRWAVTATTVRLFDARGGRTDELAGPAAAVWDLLTRHDDVAAVARLTALIADCDAVAADALVRECLAAWVAAGWLVAQEG